MTFAPVRPLGSDVDPAAVGWALKGELEVQPPGMCGGARVPNNYVPPPLAPAVHVKLRVLPGDRFSNDEPTMILETGDDGSFAAELPDGIYCLARDGRGPKPTGPVDQYTDLACLVKRWETCDAVVTVPIDATKPVDIDIIEPCSWSICYFGPPPP